jgi:NADPH:quinone reductase-like Zn-dependent oxidoreductase
MKAIVHDRYGDPGVLELREVEKPELADDGVLVRVKAASVNPFDWHMLTGTPYLARTQAGWRRPKTGLIGTDFAGVVEAVGKDVTQTKVGDEVFGCRNGAFGEYVSVRRSIAPKPSNLTFEEAAAVPMAGTTALQALRDKGELRAGQKVLVNGASGGVGTFAVQIAKAFGADVTAVCSTRNVESVGALGADRVVDYTQEDFTRGRDRYHLIVDVAGNHSWSETKRVMNADATLVIVGGPKDNRLWGSLGRAVGRRLLATLGSRTVAAPFLARITRDDLIVLKDLIEAGKVKPVVENRYELSDTPLALRYIGEGHARAKVVISV